MHNKTIPLQVVTTKIGSGSTPKGGANVYSSAGIPFIRSQNVLFGKLNLTDVVYISPKMHDSMRGTWVQPLDVLLNITGASIGRSCIVPGDLKIANVSQHVCIIRLMDKYNADFLCQYLNSHYGQYQINIAQGGGNRQGLNFGQIANIPIPDIDLKSQKKIAAVLGAWDDAIGKLDQLRLKKTKIWRIQRSKALIKMSKKFGFATIDEMTKTIIGGGTPSRQNESYWNGEIPWVSVKDLVAPVLSDAQEHISQEALYQSASNLIPAFTPIIATRMAVGRTAYFTVDVAINQDLKALVPSDVCNARYLFHCMRALEEKIAALGTGSTVNGVTLDIIREQIIPKADKSTQYAFVAFADSSEKQINILQKQINIFKSQKRDLMKKLLTGQWQINQDNECVKKFSDRSSTNDLFTVV